MDKVRPAKPPPMMAIDGFPGHAMIALDRGQTLSGNPETYSWDSTRELSINEHLQSDKDLECIKHRCENDERVSVANTQLSERLEHGLVVELATLNGAGYYAM